MTVYEKIKRTLDSNKIKYEIKYHPPTRTSEESARYRNEPLKIGAKALLIKTKNEFVLCVIPANRRLETKLLKKSQRNRPPLVNTPVACSPTARVDF